MTSRRSKNFGPEQMQGPFFIVLHHTGGSFASDIVTLTEPGKAAGGKSVSSNDLIAKDGTIYELCEYPKKAWHAGAWNRKGWGIEIENRGTAADPYPRAQIEAVVWRARERRRTLGIPADLARIKRHRDIQADKVDTSDTFPYEEVRRRIVAATDPTDDGAPATPTRRRVRAREVQRGGPRPALRRDGHRLRGRAARRGRLGDERALRAQRGLHRQARLGGHPARRARAWSCSASPPPRR